MNETAIIDWSWSVLSRLLASLVAHSGWAGGVADYVPRSLLARARSELRRMEMAARRLLVAMACDLGMARRTVPPRPRRGKRVQRARASTPGFALFDTLPDPLAGLFPSDALKGLPRGAQPDMVSAGTLAARIAALSGVIDNPLPAARRMALWLSRKKRGRTTPIRLGRLPGPRPFRITDQLATALADAHEVAVKALNRGPPKTSDD